VMGWVIPAIDTCRRCIADASEARVPTDSAVRPDRQCRKARPIVPYRQPAKNSSGADRPQVLQVLAASPWSARLGDDTGLAVKQPTSTARTFDAGLAPVPSHTYALMRSTLAACAAVDVSRVGAVLQVIPTGCRQCGLQLLGPFLVGLGESPHLIRCQLELAERRPERLASVDRVQELLPYLDS